MRSAAAMLLVALAGSGCSFQLASMSDQTHAGAERLLTGSIRPAAAAVSAQAVARAETDLALRAAASELLARNERNASVPWENPQTGARGTVTPIAEAYTQAGVTCRDFLASYLRDDTEDWLQGEACRVEHGRWEIRKFKPWTRS